MNASKIALITGSAKRIGRFICQDLANNGWKIVIHYNNSENESIELEQSLAKITSVFRIKIDFNDPSQAANMIPMINENFGQVSLLVNNCSSFINDHHHDFKTDDLIHNLNVNLISPAILIKDFINQDIFKENNDGNIINLLDYFAFSPSRNFYSYSLSKMGLKNLIKQNASLIAPKIRINGITLGPTLRAANQSMDHFNHSYQKSLLERPTEISDLLSTIYLILKTKSLTGEIISIDSGLRMMNFPDS